MYIARTADKKYNWLVAAGLHRKAADSEKVKRHLGRAATSLDRAAFCYYRAAFQAATLQEFRRRVHLAQENYVASSRLYPRNKGELGRGGLAHAKAAINFIGARLEESPRRRHKLLEEAVEAQQQVLGIIKNRMKSTETATAYVTLLQYLSALLDMEWNSKIRKGIVRIALDHSESAIRLASSLHQLALLSWSYYYASVLEGSASFLLQDSSLREHVRLNSLNHAKRSLELANKTGDCLLQCWSRILLLNRIGYAKRSPNVFRRHLTQALNSALQTKDNDAIADALLAQSIDTVWEIVSEEDPSKKSAFFTKCKRLLLVAIERYKRTLNFQGLATCYGLALAQIYYRMAATQTHIHRRHELLHEAATLARNGLSFYRKSGALGDETPAHTLAMILYDLSLLTDDKVEKSRLLGEALKLRHEKLHHVEVKRPFHSWDRGVSRYHTALVQAEFANLLRIKQKKIALLEQAASSIEEALKLCKLHFASSPVIPKHICVSLATSAVKLASILDRLHNLTGEVQYIRKLLSVLRQAVDFYQAADWPSRLAEVHWQIAHRLDQLGDYSEAYHEFELAAKAYQAAGEKMSQFKNFFSEYTLYMTAWCEIERARLASETENYRPSADHYKNAALFLEKTTKRNYSSPYYIAWSQLQEAEQLSKADRFEEATAQFIEAGRSFSESADFIRQKIASILTLEEKDEAESLAKSALIRKQYSHGRAVLEEARQHDMKGDKEQSSRLYALAKETFQQLLSHFEPSKERNEITTMIKLCQGWQVMKQAEDRSQPEMFSMAGDTFTQAARLTSRKRAASVATANACFCRAMYYGLKFRETGDMSFYSKAKIQLEAAIQHYSDAGITSAADWTEATMMLLDAHVYILQGEIETDPAKRAKLYVSAEKSLEFALKLSEAAGYQNRKSQIERDLARVKHKAELASSLVEVLSTPFPSRTGASLQAPLLEQARGLEIFEHANILTQVRVSGDTEIGRTFQLQLDLFNTGKKSALIQKIEGLVPSGLKVISQPTPFTVKDSSLDMEDKRLEPMQIQTVRLTLQGKQPADVALAPKVRYVDEEGNVGTHIIEPVTIKILAPEVFQFKTPEAQTAFDRLAESFVDDYMGRRLYIDQSGWRSLTQIADAAKISRSSVYGRHGRYGSALYELLSRGLVETRVFSGHRGRGGEVVKVRISYDKEPVKRYVDNMIMKPR